MSLFVALEFLTVLRLRPSRPTDLRSIARAQACFPAVGLLLGLILAAADRALAPAVPGLLRGALLVVLLAALTGGLHLDGLADTADGIWGGRTAEQRLAIMDDPRLGSYGALALVAALLLKWAALATLAPPTRAAALLLAPAVARWVVVPAIAAAPYGRPGGRWAEFHRQAWPRGVLLAGALALVAAVAVAGAGGLALLVAGTLVALGLARWFTGRLGGLTGDTYGAIIEVVEVVSLVLLAAVPALAAPPWMVGRG